MTGDDTPDACPEAATGAESPTQECAVKIHSESRIHHPIERVYQVYRDRLPEIAPYIPDIARIEVRSRVEGPHGPKLLNEWFASPAIPKIAQGIVTDDMKRWLDHAEWHDAEQYVAWTLELPAFGEQVLCTGRNSFYPDGKGTRVVLTGDLQIKVNRIPGVPRIMLGKIIPKVEEFVVKLITPNLERVNSSLERFIDDQA